MNGENFWEEYDEFGTLRTREVVELPGDAACALDRSTGSGPTARPSRSPRPAPSPGSTSAPTRTRSTGRESLVAGDRRRARPHAVHHLGRLRRPDAPRLTGVARHRAPARRRQPPRPVCSASRSEWCAIQGVAPYPDGVDRECGMVLADHPANPRFPTPWYGSNRADTYGDGWANFLNAAFLWDEPLDRGRRHDPRAAPSRDRPRRPAVTGARSRATWPTGSRGDERGAGRSPAGARGRDARSARTRTTSPGWRIPRAFAGHAVGADVRADLCFVLTHLADAGVDVVAGEHPDAILARLLQSVDGASTHTFFSYRIAETLARRGPFEGNPLLADCDDAQRAQVALATDSSDWLELLDTDLLPRNYAAVLARCELGREQLGLPGDPARLDALVARATARARREPTALPRRLEPPGRPLRHLHRRRLAVLRAAAPRHRTALGRGPAHRTRPRVRGRRARRHRDRVGPVDRRARCRAHRRARGTRDSRRATR